MALADHPDPELFEGQLQRFEDLRTEWANISTEAEKTAFRKKMQDGLDRIETAWRNKP